jgi:transcriptional regulator with XRE-family HTH domain
MGRTLNNNLKAILADQGISMRSLAGKTGLAVCQISRMAAGKSAQLISWYRVLNALGVDWPEMFPNFYDMEDIDDGEEGKV